MNKVIVVWGVLQGNVCLGGVIIGEGKGTRREDRIFLVVFLFFPFLYNSKEKKKRCVKTINEFPDRAFKVLS